VFDLKVGGQSVGIDEVLLVDTERFTQPENVKACCDGVLGADVLRLYSIEFRPEISSFIFYQPQGYQLDTQIFVPIEAEVSSSGQVLSHCQAQVGQAAAVKTWVHWDSGFDRALQLPRGILNLLSTQVRNLKKVGGVQKTSSAAKAKGEKSDSSFVADTESPALRVECLGSEVMRLDAQTAKAWTDQSKSGESRSAFLSPDLRVGAPFVFADSWVLDLPHGWVGLLREGKSQIAAPAVGSGIRFFFDQSERGRRQLRFLGVSTESKYFRALKKLGLKPGTVISEVDQKSVSDWDHFDVERFFASRDRREFRLKWTQDRHIREATVASGG
jgi:hypothetical protein